MVININDDDNSNINANTLNNDDDRNRQHILGIGVYQQFLHESSEEEDRSCVPNAYICWTP